MSILDKARELGEEIASSTELGEMREAEAAMMSNPEANNLVREFNEKQKIYMDLKSKGANLTDDQISEVEDIEHMVLDNPLIVDFFRKQQNFERIIEEINDIIAKAIAGEESGCSDDCCSSCQGCQA